MGSEPYSFNILIWHNYGWRIVAMRPASPLSFLRSLKREIKFKKSHTWPQTWNHIKQKIYNDNCYMKSGPTWLDLKITSRCTLKCNFCYWYRPKNLLRFNDMSYENFVRIINKFRQVYGLALSGGEPFLNRDIFNMTKYAHKHKIKVEIITNGTIIHDLLDRIISSPLSLLNISLDAYDSSEYRRMRGGSRRLFGAIFENIRNLVEKRDKSNSALTLQVSFICTKANYGRIPDKVQLSKDLGVDIVVFDNLIPFGIPSFLEDQCLYDDDSDVMEVIESAKKPDSKLTVIMPTLYKKNIVERNCKEPFLNLTIDGDGNISTCCMIAPRRNHGNVFYDKDVWNNVAYQRIRRRLLDKSLPLPNFCKTCHGLGSERIVVNKKK